MFGKIALFSCILHLTLCDWVSEWMSPVQRQFKDRPSRRSNEFGGILFDDDEKLHMIMETTERFQDQMLKKYSVPHTANELSTASLKTKLENTLGNARMLAETLRTQISEVSERENLLKDAIVNGRSGVSTVVVSMMERPPRTYIIREGRWTECKGEVRGQLRSFGEITTEPKCVGQEMSTQQDPCVFNSVIKYETLPTVRRAEYSEDDYLCLKSSFNNTLERYMSVPKQIIHNTCQSGTVRSLEENVEKCGLRVLTEYTYYPSKNSVLGLPLEYCAEPDGACKLIMAWHVSNSTIENFEFLKNEQGFKKYFIKTISNIEHMI